VFERGWSNWRGSYMTFLRLNSQWTLVFITM
jgi:hypothetical protein